MASQADNQAKIDNLTGGLQKVKAEVADLKARYEAGQTLDFSAADQELAAVDALNDDAVVTPPAGEEQPPAEPTA